MGNRDDLAEYVIDFNISRRHMSTGARAMATALVLAEDGRRANGRWAHQAISQPENEEISSFSTWRSFMQRAGVILDYKPSLAKEVINSDIAFDVAYQKANDIKKSAERDKILARERAKREREEAKPFKNFK